ncbi:MAG: 6-phosphogluconolactonase [Anaerolineae bacterium]
MKTPAPELLVYADRKALARAAADLFVETAAQAIGANGRFTVALSGGTTPRDLYAELASPEYQERVDWARCHFFWGDERPAPPDDPQSNFRMADQTLLSQVPVPRNQIYRILGEQAPEAAAGAYDQTLHAFWGEALPHFDLVLLGLGSNGHTASLFPYTTVLHETRRWCAAVWVQELNTYRITLTAPVLNAGHRVVFIVTGADKAETVRDVVRGPYAPERLPAQLIQPTDGKLLWYLDQYAAGAVNKQ